jgi:hypothetical protein
MFDFDFEGCGCGSGCGDSSNCDEWRVFRLRRGEMTIGGAAGEFR